MASLGSYVEIIIDTLLDAILLIFNDALIPAMQSLVPGSDNTIWATTSYLFLVFAVILFAIWRVVNKMES